MGKNKYPLTLLLILSIFFIWSSIKPHDYLTWILEVFPAIAGVGVLISTYNRFRLTNLLYLLITLHSIVLIIGGHYTYAEVPWFNWLRDHHHLNRNYYDRIGHFMQGFVPAMIAREILIRKSPVKSGRWLIFFVICICGSITAIYELFEWLVALLSKTAAESFLGTQGDVWDTQWDMFMAFIGAVSGLIFFSKIHTDQLRQLEKRSEN